MPGLASTLKNHSNEVSQEDRTASVLREFSDIEADSSWQYLHAMQFTEDDELKRMLLLNALEERNHADIFLRLHQQIRQHQISLPHKARKPLIEAPEQLPAFLAYVHYGEASVHKNFVKYANSCSDQRIAQAFKKISEDEEGHESNIYDYLTKICGDQKRADKQVNKARWKYRMEAWMRHSQKLGDFMFNLLLSLVYLIFGLIIKFPYKK